MTLAELQKQLKSLTLRVDKLEKAERPASVPPRVDEPLQRDLTPEEAKERRLNLEAYERTVGQVKSEGRSLQELLGSIIRMTESHKSSGGGQ